MMYDVNYDVDLLCIIYLILLARFLRGGAPLCGITILTSKCTEIMSLHDSFITILSTS